jgi:hypothetical protein
MADGSSPPGEAGQELVATGIVHWKKGRPEIIVGSLSDLTATDVVAPETADKTGSVDDSATKILALATQKSEASGPPTWVIVLTLASMAGIGTWTLFSRRRAAPAGRD